MSKNDEKKGCGGILFTVLVVILASIGGRIVGGVFGELTADRLLPKRGEPALVMETDQDYNNAMDDAVQTDSYSTSVSGHWGEERLVTNLGYTYPLELDEPLYKCRGFTLNYALVEVTSGEIYGNTTFKIFVRNTSGEWVGAGLFDLDAQREAVVEVTLDYTMSVEAVAVMCQEDGIGYSHIFTISNVR